MHELAICESLLDQVACLARKYDQACVVKISVAVGALSGVDPALLASAFALVRRGTCAEYASLAIDPIPVCVSCAICGALTQVPPDQLTCMSCGDYRTEVVEGEELQLRQIEVRLAGGAEVMQAGELRLPSVKIF